jgi:hypothetical protein
VKGFLIIILSQLPLVVAMVILIQKQIPKKSAKEQAGREKGAFAYGAEEHLTLLSFITMTPNAFNAGETSLEWRLVHSKMVEVYQGMGVSPRQSTMLHSHFVELYSALKQGIRVL